MGFILLSLKVKMMIKDVRPHAETLQPLEGDGRNTAGNEMIILLFSPAG